MKLIADTGFLVAFANRGDRFHRWATELAEQLEPPALTCEAVLSETASHLESSRLVVEMVQSGLVAPVFSLVKELRAIDQLAARYADRKPDLADLCLVRLSELYPGHRVATVDVRDFQVYRRNGRQVIPTATPPLTSR